jgi:NADPH2:quinone reductase
MRALRFEKTGSLDDLSIRELPIPTPAAGEVLVQVKAAAVNPSDVKNVQGKMHETSVPRTPGRDFAGVVAGGLDELSGQAVFGSGGNLGFGRDGSHAEYVVVPANAVLPLPRNFSFEQAAAIGVAYITAWAALVNAARIQPGETGGKTRLWCRWRLPQQHYRHYSHKEGHRLDPSGSRGSWSVCGRRGSTSDQIVGCVCGELWSR